MKNTRTCKEAGCERPESTSGWCSAHYQRQRKGRASSEPIKVYKKESKRGALRPCGVEGCGGGREIVRGLCSLHYGRLRKHGDPLKVNRPGRKPMPMRVNLPNEASPTKLGKLLGVSKQRAHQLLNREAHNARLALGKALKAGTVTKPDSCERCQKPSVNLEAHHWDYREALDVRWLCRPCHVFVHPHGNKYGAKGKPTAQSIAA